MTEQEFSQFYQQNLDKIFRFLYLRVDKEEIAKDLTAQVFLKFWQRQLVLSNQKESKVFPLSNPQAFLFQIARHQLIDFYRQKKNHPLSLEELFNQGKDIPQESFTSQVELNFELEQLKKHLQKINALYSEVIIWHYVDDLSVKEIAQILQKNENNVRVLLHRAIESLKAQINTDKNR